MVGTPLAGSVLAYDLMALGDPILADAHGGCEKDVADTWWSPWHWNRCDRVGKARCGVGSGEILLNSMDADGTTDGFDIRMIQEVREVVSIPVIASGGGRPPRGLCCGRKSGRRCRSRGKRLPLWDAVDWPGQGRDAGFRHRGPLRGNKRAEYELSGSYMRKTVQLLGHALRTEPLRFSISIGLRTLRDRHRGFGSLLGVVLDDVVIPAIRREADSGVVWANRPSRVRGPILLAGVAFIAIALSTRRSSQCGAPSRAAPSRASAPGTARSWPTLSPPFRSGGTAPTRLGGCSRPCPRIPKTATNPLHPLAFTVGSFTMMIAAGYRLAVMDRWLAITAMMVIPAVLAVNYLYERVISPLWDRGQSLRADVSTIAHESFEGGTVVKALGAERQESDRFAVKVDGLRDADTRVGAVSAWFEPLMDAMVPLSSLAIMVVGAHRAAAGAGDRRRRGLCHLPPCPPRRAHQGIGWVLGQMPSALVSFQRVASISAAATEVDEPGTPRIAREGAGRWPSGSARGRRRRRGKSRRDREGRDARSRPWHRHGARGPTGAGKTTVALAAARLSRALEGEVILDGTNIEVVEELGRTWRSFRRPRLCSQHGARQRDARRGLLGRSGLDRSQEGRRRRRCFRTHQHGNALDAELESGA